MTRPLPLSRLAGLLALLLFSGACGVIDVNPPASAGGACAQDSDCNAGLKCYQRRICVAKDVPPTPVVLRLTPPADSGLLVEQFDFVLDGASQATPVKLVLTDPAIVRGTLTQQGNPLAESIPGTLIATAPAAVDGRDLSYTATSFAVQKVFPGADQAHGYELRVQPGYTYALAFWPESKDIPPFYPQPIKVNGNITAWQLELPGLAQLLHVSGQIVLAGQPLAGLRVALEDKQGRVRSTLAVTDASGSFALLVDPTAPSGVLHLEPAVAKDALPRGRLPVLPDLYKAALKNAPIELGILDLGDSAVAVPVQVRVQGVNGAKVPGALVTVSRVLQGLKKSGDKGATGLEISVTGYADGNGVFSTTMAPGPLAVTVVPPPKSASAVQHWAGVFPGGDLVMQCPARLQVQGKVHDFAAREIEDAQVSLRRVGTSGPSDASVVSDDQAIAALVDGHGGFTTLVDPGSYDVWVEPAKTSGLPRVLAARIDVAADSVPAPLTLVLPPPMVLAGSVLSVHGKSVAGVLIDVLTVKPAQPLAGGKPGEGKATPALGAMLDSHLLATTVSGIHGTFEVLLAPGQVK